MAASLDVVEPAPATATNGHTATRNTKHMASRGHSCPECGTQVHVPEDRDMEEAQRRIKELEAQVELLKEKATAAVDRCADYEDQLRMVKAHHNDPAIHRTNTSDSLAPGPRSPSYDDTARPSSSQSTKTSRFSFLTGVRRNSPASLTPQPAQQTPSHSPSPSDAELLSQLEKERQLRAKAEEKARKVDMEIEELSVQLFSQANEMVAQERKARAKLEARVEQLEKRDREKMARLDRLEKAVGRIERVKAMLGAPPAAKGTTMLVPPSASQTAARA